MRDMRACMKELASLCPWIHGYSKKDRQAKKSAQK